MLQSYEKSREIQKKKRVFSFYFRNGVTSAQPMVCQSPVPMPLVPCHWRCQAGPHDRGCRFGLHLPRSEDQGRRAGALQRQGRVHQRCRQRLWQQQRMGRHAGGESVKPKHPPPTPPVQEGRLDTSEFLKLPSRTGGVGGGFYYYENL